MSRRVAKYYFLLAKIDPRLPEYRADDYDPLVRLLENVMAPRANRRFGRAGQDSAYADEINFGAAHHALDLTGKCQMHFTSNRREEDLLTWSYRTRRRLAKRLEDQADAEVRQEE